MDSDEAIPLESSLLVAIVETERRVDELRNRHEKLQEMVARFPNDANRQRERELRVMRVELSVRLNDLNRQLRLQRSLATRTRANARRLDAEPLTPG